MEKENKKIGATILIIGIVALVNTMTFIEMNKAQIKIPDEYTLESNESGVLTYKNNLNNGYKLEIKEDTNPNGIKKEDMYGSIMKCTIDNKNYIITCYIPVNKTKVVTPGRQPYDVSDIKIHPGVKPVQCVNHATELTYPGIFVSVYPKEPYESKTLNDINETGNLNAISIKQSLPPTFTEGA